jgi:hypothetical protein
MSEAGYAGLITAAPLAARPVTLIWDNPEHPRQRRDARVHQRAR